MKLLSTFHLGLPILLAIWLLASIFGWTSPLFFPSLVAVVRALVVEVSSSSFWLDLGATVFRALAGLAFSSLIGLPVGLALGRSTAFYNHLKLPIDLVRSIPAATLFPLFILVFGIGHLSKIAVAFFGCVFILLMGALYGARETPETRKRVALMRSLRANKYQIFRLVIFPGALPSILSALRIATSIALVLVIVTEMFLGSNDGLGKRIYDAYLAYQVPSMYALLLLLGLLGFALNLLIELADECFLPTTKG